MVFLNLLKNKLWFPESLQQKLKLELWLWDAYSSGATELNFLNFGDPRQLSLSLGMPGSHCLNASYLDKCSNDSWLDLLKIITNFCNFFFFCNFSNVECDHCGSQARALILRIYNDCWFYLSDAHIWKIKAQIQMGHLFKTSNDLHKNVEWWKQCWGEK